MDDEGDSDLPDLPIVTVLGGGIAGLTAAHELVERGFDVQVVESQPSSTEEYQCDVGGLAANQFARVRAPIALLHDELYTPGHDKELKAAKKFRKSDKIEATSARFPILRAIRFDKALHCPAVAGGAAPKVPPPFDMAPRTPREPAGAPTPAQWQDYWDDYGTKTGLKLDDVLDTIRVAAQTYMRLYFPALAKRLALGTEPDDAEWIAEKFSPIDTDPVSGRRFVARETLLVQVIGYTDTDGTLDENRVIADFWATQVRDELIARNDARPLDVRIWQLSDMLVTVAQGAAEPRFDQSTAVGRARSNRVEFEIVEQRVPGEHGFRFFPAFYRHLLDTMRRTPMFDDQGRVQGGTAFDQLVPTPDSRIALDDGTGPQDFNVRTIRSLRQVDSLLMMFVNQLDMTPRDLLGLQFFTLRYLLSGASRRQQEAEPISFVDYIQTIGGPGPSADGTPPKSRFSQPALDFIDQAPRALAAMSARESDARTQYDIAAQLMMTQPNGPVYDMTLNGPTTTAWLDHWKNYLKTQGVRFFTGQVDSLQEKGGRLLPVFDLCDPDKPNLLPEDAMQAFVYPTDDEVDQHRYVLSTSFQHASDLVWGAFRAAGGAADPSVFSGPFKQLTEFDEAGGRRTIADLTAPDPVRDPATGKPPEIYPLRTISGLQFFFPEEYRFGQGNVFFVDTPWALTSISQFPYWRDRVRPVGPLLGQITVDVGNWHEFYPKAAPGVLPGHPAWYSSRQEIADKTWSQIKDGLATDYAALIKPPAYFHIDRNIIFAEHSQLGYQGSALLRVVAHDPAARARKVLPSLQVTAPERWARYQADGSPAVPAHVSHEGIDLIWVMGWLARSYGDKIFTVPIESDSKAVGGQQDLLVSPTASDKRHVVAFRGESSNPFYLEIDGQAMPAFRIKEVGQRSAALERVTGPAGVHVEQLDAAATTFALTKTVEFRLAVANEDGAIELLDGPVLEISDIGNIVRVAGKPLPPSGRATLAAVRANAVLHLPKDRPDGAEGGGIQPGRIYGIAFGVGVSKPVDPHLEFTWEARRDDTPTSVRDRFLEMIREQPDSVLVEPLGPASLVQSPVALLRRAVISFLGVSTEPFHIYLDGVSIALDPASMSAEDRSRDLATKIGAGFKVEALAQGRGPGGLAVAITRDDPTVPFRIGVLNVDGMIELVGAPALTIETKEFILEEPESGFVVLRNDAEYLINIPDQFRYRPGVRRGAAAAAIPPSYRALGRLFGNPATEIYYGHDKLLLKNWVMAGTYMGTYTRITTMESANESGRHAASAIVFDVKQDVAARAAPEPILIADLPQIWKVEDNEPDDLKFLTDLDEALFADGLPHVLDILSVTQLVTMLLEADLKDDKVHAFLSSVKSILDGSMKTAHQGMKAGGLVFSQLVGAYADLTQSIIGTVTGTDPVSKALKQVLDQVQEASKTYKSLWGG